MAAVSLETVSLRSPGGAGPLIVTVPVTERPPVTAERLSVKLVGVGRTSVKEAEAEPPFATAVIFTVVVWVTPLVWILKEACVWPAETVTDAGSVAAAESLLSDTITPPAGAGMERVTVPMMTAPPVAAALLKVILAGTGGIASV